MLFVLIKSFVSLHMKDSRMGVTWGPKCKNIKYLKLYLEDSILGQNKKYLTVGPRFCGELQGQSTGPMINK